VCGNRRLHQRERIEDSHRLPVPPLRTKDFPKHFQCAGVMLMCTEHLQAFFLRGRNLAAGQILARKIHQRCGIGRGRHL
jgi:hypothetical protein